MNSTATAPTAAHNLNGFFAYKNTFDQDSIWLEVPKTGETTLFGRLEELQAQQHSYFRQCFRSLCNFPYP